MTEEQIAALVKLEAQGNHSGFRSDFEAEARNILPRLLEERKRLLEALRRLESPRSDSTARETLFRLQEEARLTARAAIAFAEAEAP